MKDDSSETDSPLVTDKAQLHKAKTVGAALHHRKSNLSKLNSMNSEVSDSPIDVKPAGGSPNKYDEDDEDFAPPPQEVILPGVIYKQLLNQFPANPILPRSFAAREDSPRSGGMFKFLKLSKFRGVDEGRSKFR